MSESSAAELLARARGLLPKLIERSVCTTQERRVPDETIADFQQAGFFRILQPKRYGGLQMEFQVFANLVRELAQGCGSSAWVYAVMAEHGWMFSLFPREGQEEIWSGNPNARGCAAVDPSGKAEKVDGGYRLTGQWRFVSGSDHAQWAFLTVPSTEGEDFMTVRQLLVRRAELKALDDWHVMGLIGTGSRTLVADNIFVPERRAITQEQMMLGTAPGASVHPDYPLIRTPRRYLTPFSLSPVLIGLANRALALVMEGTRKRTAGGALPPDFDTLQLRIAETAADLDAANTLLDAHLTQATARIAAGEAIGERDIARSRMAGAYIARLAHAATARLCMATGSGWIFNNSPLQEIFRDVTAGATHRAMNFEMLGKNYVRALGIGAPH
jgi:alkylation response protein AidB-like acyl-CoA dehydrogenase